MREHGTQQSGFAVGVVVLAVILLSVITSAMAVSFNNINSNKNSESYFLLAGVLLQQATTINQAMTRYYATGGDTIRDLDQLIPTVLTSKPTPPFRAMDDPTQEWRIGVWLDASPSTPIPYPVIILSGLKEGVDASFMRLITDGRIPFIRIGGKVPALMEPAQQFASLIYQNLIQNSIGMNPAKLPLMAAGLAMESFWAKPAYAQQSGSGDFGDGGVDFATDTRAGRSAMFFITQGACQESVPGCSYSLVRDQCTTSRLSVYMCSAGDSQALATLAAFCRENRSTCAGGAYSVGDPEVDLVFESQELVRIPSVVDDGLFAIQHDGDRFPGYGGVYIVMLLRG